MRIDITEKNMVWLVEHKMADTIVAEFHRKETVIESLVRELDEARAELTTIRASSFTTAVPSEEYEKLRLQFANSEQEVARLQAEVERLRKAGDAMADAIKWLPQTISDHHQQAWNAAKEGKQS